MLRYAIARLRRSQRLLTFLLQILGALLNWGFMGVLLPQLYTYNTHYPNDAAWMKALGDHHPSFSIGIALIINPSVYSLAILEVLQTCLVTADAFHWFVFGYGNMARLDDTFLNSWDVPLLDAVVALVAQLFYCWRILILRPKSYIILGSIILVRISSACLHRRRSYASGRHSAVRCGNSSRCSSAQPWKALLNWRERRRAGYLALGKRARGHHDHRHARMDSASIFCTLLARILTPLQALNGES